eukprot:3107781-Pleurochrysis_carterae.AAC.1
MRASPAPHQSLLPSPSPPAGMCLCPLIIPAPHPIQSTSLSVQYSSVHCLGAHRHIPRYPVYTNPRSPSAVRAPSSPLAGDLCPALGMSSLPALYRRAKRDKARTIQPRLEELVSKKTGPAAWRQLFKFVNLAEKGSDLTTLAMQIVARLELRSVVHNRAAPGWVRAKIEHNATLLAWLRRLQWDLEYTGAGKGALPPMR